jgi:hypothetical protein
VVIMLLVQELHPESPEEGRKGATVTSTFILPMHLAISHRHVCPSIYTLSVSSNHCIFTHPPIHPFAHPSITCPSIPPSTHHLSVHLSKHPSILCLSIPSPHSSPCSPVFCLI